MLYDRVKYLFDHPEEQRSLGLEAYRTMLDTWNAKIAAERFLQLSEAILSGEKHPEFFADGPCSIAKKTIKNRRNSS
jgi:hypothetical protein